MASIHPTYQSKSNKIINFSTYSGAIDNLLYRDGASYFNKDISSEPDAAFFDREGRVLAALQKAYESHKSQRRSGGFLISQFIEQNATICKDYVQLYKWCRQVLQRNPPDDWESAVLGLFEQTYPLYPQEPLLRLIKPPSRVFIERDGMGYEA